MIQEWLDSLCEDVVELFALLEGGDDEVHVGSDPRRAGVLADGGEVGADGVGADEVGVEVGAEDGVAGWGGSRVGRGSAGLSATDDGWQTAETDPEGLGASAMPRTRSRACDLTPSAPMTTSPSYTETYRGLVSPGQRLIEDDTYHSPIPSHSTDAPFSVSAYETTRQPCLTVAPSSIARLSRISCSSALCVSYRGASRKISIPPLGSWWTIISPFHLRIVNPCAVPCVHATASLAPV